MMTLRGKYDFPYFIYKLRLFQRNQSNLLTNTTQVGYLKFTGLGPKPINI